MSKSIRPWDETLKLFREKHGSKYEYDETTYNGSNAKMRMICPKHGEFYQTPNKHLLGRGCPYCGGTKRLTTDEFIKRAEERYPNKYTYEKTIYKSKRDNVIITCKKHGDFSVKADTFLTGCGCPLCKKEYTDNAAERFIEKAKEKHPKEEELDYSYVSYANYHTPVAIYCHKKDEFGVEHGIFYQTPGHHLSGEGCPKCNSNIKLTTDEFIRRAKLKHENKYEYFPDKYRGYNIDTEIYCKKCNKVFTQTPHNHLKGEECPYCKSERISLSETKTNSQFIQEAIKVFGNRYDYSETEYKGANQEVGIICHEKDTLGNEHGKFWKLPYLFLHGVGCPKCSGNESKLESELYEYIKSITDEKIERNLRNLMDDAKEIDIYVPSLKIGFEFDGLIWHSERFKSDKNYHLNKTNICLSKGIRLIHIFEDEWTLKKEIVKSRIKSLLHKNDKIIYARKCVVKEVSSGVYKSFVEGNHLQGFVNSKYRYGLFYNNKLISVMSFGSLRKNLGSISLDNEYELLRFCNKLNTSVVGGASKLLKYFIEKIHPKRIISYADRRWSNGELYDKLGFNFVKNTSPGYFYIVGNHRENRFKYRKDVLVKEGFSKNKTEHEIMLERKIYRIYDCGMILFEWANK